MSMIRLIPCSEQFATTATGKPSAPLPYFKDNLGNEDGAALSRQCSGVPVLAQTSQHLRRGNVRRPGFVMELFIAAGPETRFRSTEKTEHLGRCFLTVPTAEPAAPQGCMVPVCPACTTAPKTRKFSTKQD